MSKSPRWKVYDSEGDYEGSCKSIHCAAAVVALCGDGATIRDGHRRVVWTEGDNGDGIAMESYDYVAEVVDERISVAS